MFVLFETVCLEERSILMAKQQNNQLDTIQMCFMFRIIRHDTQTR